MIILHRVGDLWDLNAQQTLRAVVRDFISELSLTEAEAVGLLAAAA